MRGTIRLGHGTSVSLHVMDLRDLPALKDLPDVLNLRARFPCNPPKPIERGPGHHGWKSTPLPVSSVRIRSTF